MTTHIFDSTSVTVRIPNNILDLIDTKANDFGIKGKRSETIINLLKKALDLPVPIFALGVEKTDNTESQKVLELEQKIKALVESLESVRQENTKLDTAFSVIEKNIDDKISKVIETFEAKISALPKNEFVSEEIEKPIEQIASTLFELEPVINQSVDTTDRLQSINSKLLAVRLKLNSASAIASAKFKHKTNEIKFYEWLQEKDPDKIRWEEGIANDRVKSWIPAKDTSIELLRKLEEWLTANP